tara:strand:+ start:56 stop:190 length:135 start_codon:yes stop_codon:yes gene_type:complete
LLNIFDQTEAEKVAGGNGDERKIPTIEIREIERLQIHVGTEYKM